MLFIWIELHLRHDQWFDVAEPSAVQLIVQFMQQAEVEMAALIQNTREQNAASVVGDIRVDGANGMNQAALHCL